MSVKKHRKNIPFSFRECMAKCLIMLATVLIGLWCGYYDSYDSFYIAVMIQAFNNIYDSFGFLTGYNRLITGFQSASFCAAGLAAIASVIHFTKYGAWLNTKGVLITVGIFLCIPIVHWGIEAYLMFRNDLY